MKEGGKVGVERGREEERKGGKRKKLLFSAHREYNNPRLRGAGHFSYSHMAWE